MKMMIGLITDPTFKDEVLGDKGITTWFTSLGRFDRIITCDDITVQAAVTLVNLLKKTEGVQLVSPNTDYTL